MDKSGGRAEERLRSLRLLLSWREKAARIRAMPPHQRPALDYNTDAYPTVDVYLDAQQAEAKRYLERLREEARREASQGAKRLRESLDEQRSLIATATKLGAEAANAKNRICREHIFALREEIKTLDRAAAARYAKEAGGFMDLPVEDYPTAIAGARGGGKRSRRRVPWRMPFGGGLDFSDKAALSVAAVVVVAALGLGLYLTQWRSSVRFEVVPPTAAPDEKVEIRCRNDSSYPVYLRLPWRAGAEDRSRRDMCGILVYVRGRGLKDYRFFPGGSTMWTHQGTRTARRGPIEVKPGMTRPVHLHLSAFKQLTEPIATVRLVFICGGKTVRRETFSLPIDENG